MGFLGLQDLKVKPETRFSPVPLPKSVACMKPHPISESYVGAEKSRTLTPGRVTWTVS